MLIDVIGDWLHIGNKKVEEITTESKKYSSGKNTCQFIVVHGTATAGVNSAHNSFKNPEHKASWHLTIDRDGKVYQLYDFKKITWHAGKSSWNHLDGMNNYSIGIELVNAGPLDYKNGNHYTYYGQIVQEKDVEWDASGNPFQKYTKEQIESSKAVILALAKHYKCHDVLGHSQVSPGRKTDPYMQGMRDIVNPIRKMMGTL